MFIFNCDYFKQLQLRTYLNTTPKTLKVSIVCIVGLW